MATRKAVTFGLESQQNYLVGNQFFANVSERSGCGVVKIGFTHQTSGNVSQGALNIKAASHLYLGAPTFTYLLLQAFHRPKEHGGALLYLLFECCLSRADCLCCVPALDGVANHF